MKNTSTTTVVEPPDTVARKEQFVRSCKYTLSIYEPEVAFPASKTVVPDDDKSQQE